MCAQTMKMKTIFRYFKEFYGLGGISVSALIETTEKSNVFGRR